MQARPNIRNAITPRNWLILSGVFLLVMLAIFTLRTSSNATYKGVYIISQTQSNLYLANQPSSAFVIVNPEHLDNAKTYVDIFWPIDSSNRQPQKFYAEFKGHLSDRRASASNGDSRQILYATHVVRLEKLQ